ncbi:pimeloyl-ACP methyl ester carboxylesterase [Mycetocola sp. CAN_C7]|uniref:alpha/beta fold hydrolase n=1 Tax=Mycetocola sp. CAN_C7 TaxID=2787724 RepID=UPI0018CA147C
MSRVSRQQSSTTSPETQRISEKRFRRTLRITGVIAATALGITLASTAANSFLEHQERSSIARYGDLVKVAGGAVNVYRAGTEGAQPLVLLSGLGTIAPALDFAPLIRELSSYDVIVVEGFGYGYSETSVRERTVKNISTELHDALSSLDLGKPYVLAGYSIAGFYTLDYANRYPSEVSAVIGIDPTVPAANSGAASSPGGSINFEKVLATIGLVRTVVSIAPSLAEPSSDDFTPAELERMRRMTSWNYGNAAVADETARMGSNAAFLYGMTYPDDLPVLNFLASESVATIPHWLELHENQLQNVSHSEIVELEGPHYLHWSQSRVMAEKITDFLLENAASQEPSTPRAASTILTPGS